MGVGIYANFSHPYQTLGVLCMRRRVVDEANLHAKGGG